MNDIDAILARLERLEEENADLRRRLDNGERSSSVTDPTPGDSVSRRGLLRRAGAAVAAAGVGALGATIATLSHAEPVRADGEAITVGGTFTDATVLTTLENRTNDKSLLVGRSRAGGTGIVGDSATGFGGYFVSGAANGVYGQSGGVDHRAIGAHGVGLGPATGDSGESGSGFGVDGVSVSGTGIRGRSTSGVGVTGQSESHSGIIGFSQDGTGVEGESVASDGVRAVSHAVGGAGVRGQVDTANGVGVRGYAWDGSSGSGRFGTGVVGSSGSHASPPPAHANTGVLGVGARGRGGVFIGDLAQVQMVASTASTHPATGLRGDLFVDKSGRLWYCKGGTSWRQLA